MRRRPASATGHPSLVCAYDVRVFASIAQLVARRPLFVLLGWVIAGAAMLALALGGIGDGGLFQRSVTGLPTVKGSESTVVYEHLVDTTDPSERSRLTVEFRDVVPADASLQERVADAATAVSTRDGVVAVVWPAGALPGPAFADAGTGPSPTPDALIGTGGESFLVVVYYAPFDLRDDATAEHDAAGALLAAAAGSGADAKVFSSPLLSEDFTTQIERDLLTGEAVALPVALLVMVFVFGGFLAASAPLAGAFASIAGGLAVLFGFSYVIDLDQSAINVVTVLAIGLSIDYGLLIVSRYREEVARLGDSRAHDVRAEALAVTLSTAGRTVFYSAVTVAISVGGMLVFSAELISGVGGAALGAVVMALVSSLTLVPAVLYLFGHAIAKPSVLSRIPGVRGVLRRTADVSSEHGMFSSLAARVQRAPWLVVGGVTAVLLVLASPLTDIAVRNSDIQLLPASNERRQVLDGFDARYPALASQQIDIIADATPAQLDAWMEGLTAVEGVARVTPATERGGRAVAGIFTDYPDQASEDATALVRQLRAVEAPFPVFVGGQAGIQVDFIDSLADGAPWAFGLVVAATFVLLFLMTGSLLVPVKTLLINALSLSATLGILTWIFVDGNLAGVLGFTSTGGIETYVLVMIIAFGFGLSMDYEVFLLARIKEHVDEGVPTEEAVRRGLQRSGRIISSAAAVIILVFTGFATGQLLVIKQVGIGLAIAVFLDATLVRMLLVPATMTLLNEWNWWAPARLRRLYERRGIAH